MDVKILKERVCQAIDAHREEIIALGDSIFAEPELGYKEYLGTLPWRGKQKYIVDKIISVRE